MKTVIFIFKHKKPKSDRQISSEEQLLNRKIDKSINVKSVEMDFNYIWWKEARTEKVVNGCHEDGLEDGDTDDD